MPRGRRFASSCSASNSSPRPPNPRGRERCPTSSAALAKLVAISPTGVNGCVSARVLRQSPSSQNARQLPAFTYVDNLAPVFCVEGYSTFGQQRSDPWLPSETDPSARGISAFLSTWTPLGTTRSWTSTRSWLAIARPATTSRSPACTLVSPQFCRLATVQKAKRLKGSTLLCQPDGLPSTGTAR